MSIQPYRSSGILVQVNINVPLELHERHRKEGWKWRYVLQKGIEAIDNNPKLTERIRDLEEENGHFVAKVDELKRRLWVLENPEDARRLSV